MASLYERKNWVSNFFIVQDSYAEKLPSPFFFQYKLAEGFWNKNFLQFPAYICISFTIVDSVVHVVTQYLQTSVILGIWAIYSLP